jgi:DeoR family fructose operon transcriptional repressor
MLKAARRRVLLADHSKVGRISLYKYGDLSEIDLLITDTGMSDVDARRFEDVGVEVVRT